MGLVPVEEIARRRGLSASAVRRHRDAHLGPQMLAALEASESFGVEQLEKILVGTAGRALIMLDRAEAGEDLPLARLLLRGVRETVLAVAKLAGYLAPTPVHVDARSQTLALVGEMSSDDLRELITAASRGSPIEPDGAKEAAQWGLRSQRAYDPDLHLEMIHPWQRGIRKRPRSEARTIVHRATTRAATSICAAGGGRGEWSVGQRPDRCQRLEGAYGARPPGARANPARPPSTRPSPGRDVARTSTGRAGGAHAPLRALEHRALVTVTRDASLSSSRETT